MKIAAQGSALTAYGVGGDKQVSDLMNANVRVEWTGTDGKVLGDFPNVTDFKGFSKTQEEQSGHYFAFEVDEQYDGEKITVEGAAKKTAQDRFWVIRLDKLVEQRKKLTVSKGENTLFALDFSEATLDK